MKGRHNGNTSLIGGSEFFAQKSMGESEQEELWEQVH
jgi:hypothetical protein